VTRLWTYSIFEFYGSAARGANGVAAILLFFFLIKFLLQIWDDYDLSYKFLIRMYLYKSWYVYVLLWDIFIIFLSYGIIKYDGFSKPWIDETISKRLFICPHEDATQRYLDGLSWLYRLRRLRLYSTIVYRALFFTLCLVSRILSHTLTRLCCPRPLYTQKWCYISDLANRCVSIASSRELPGVNDFFPRLSVRGFQHSLVRVGAFDICRHR
jgi:hypothetical protein